MPLRRKKVGIAVVVLVCAPFLIAGMISGVRRSLDSKPASAASRSPLASPSTPLAPTHRASGVKPSPTCKPTFAYPGDPHCAITYHDDGNGTMSWTANVTVAGELITHASDNSGNMYRRDVQVTPGANRFTAPVPLSQIDDVGGVLYVGSISYGCSIAP
jgi:hypothetical protein